MSKHHKRTLPKSAMPTTAVRKPHPETGLPMWNIGGMWFRSKRDYFAFIANLQAQQSAAAMLPQDGPTTQEIPESRKIVPAEQTHNDTDVFVDAEKKPWTAVDLEKAELPETSN